MKKLKVDTNKCSDELLNKWVVGMPNEQADRLLVEKIACDMQRKLEKKRSQGAFGWHTPIISNEDLLEKLKEHIEKGDMVDVINLAAMIHCRTLLYGRTAQ